MSRAVRVVTVLAATAAASAIGGVAHAECTEPANVVMCGEVRVGLTEPELSGGTLSGVEAIGILPDGRWISASELDTTCDGGCALRGVRVWDANSDESLVFGRLDASGFQSEELIVAFAPPARPGLSAVAARWVNDSPVAGVTGLLPLNSRRAVGIGGQAGPDAFATTLALYDGEQRSSRIDVGATVGEPSFLVSGRERIELGGIAELSLDGSLGNRRGRELAAGSQRHIGLGREELTLAFTTGGRSGKLALRYTASRGALRQSDAVHVDAVVTEQLRPFRTHTHLGATAAATPAGFHPGAGAAFVASVPIGQPRWEFAPRLDLRAVGEEAERDSADAAGAAAGVEAHIAILDARELRVELAGDADWGATMANRAETLRSWSQPLQGWRAGGAVELALGPRRTSALQWRVLDAEHARGSATHVLSATTVLASASVAAELVVHDGEWIGTYSVAEVNSPTFGAYLAAAARTDGFRAPRSLGTEPLRLRLDSDALESTATIGFRANAGIVRVETETTYVVGRAHERSLAGRGRAAVRLPGRDWGIGAEGGRLVHGDAYATLHFQLGSNPGLWLTHTR